MRSDKTTATRLGRGIFFDHCEMMGHESILDFRFSSMVKTTLPSQEIRFAMLEAKIGNRKSNTL
jgi:hypothetical protein